MILCIAAGFPAAKKERKKNNPKVEETQAKEKVLLSGAKGKHQRAAQCACASVYPPLLCLEQDALSDLAGPAKSILPFLILTLNGSKICCSEHRGFRPRVAAQDERAWVLEHMQEKGG